MDYHRDDPYHAEPQIDEESLAMLGTASYTFFAPDRRKDLFVVIPHHLLK